ncbi:hypothetical protein Pmani_033275 [Petrolisthes manimaculis]|uniref:Uncharacterized protein n=1 Tax=Petrolisthes manimaculis TaxID=1843537 RepID=A0AAE1TSW2_9EUCA|nr:hypothetical protein Pmani_033275 [Petrolisthes manimaculis]
MFFTTVYLEKLFYRSVKLSLAKHFYRNFTSRVLPDLTDNGVSIYEALSLTTHWISEEVDDVRVLLQILLHRHQHDSQTKAEIREVLEVVGEWPGFKICRVFTLDRARLVDVSSFVVTYLIILLQFRITEMN